MRSATWHWRAWKAPGFHTTPPRQHAAPAHCRPGNARAQCALGLVYLKGAGARTMAARFLKLANDQGFQPARDALGHLTTACLTGTRVLIMGLATGRIAVRIDGQTKSSSVSWATAQQRTPRQHPRHCRVSF